MQRITQRAYILILTMLMAVATTSCRKNLYDEDALIDATKKLVTVDNIDSNHSWNLTTKRMVNADATWLSLGLKKVQVWSANPLAGEATNILEEAEIEDGQQKNIFFTAPADQRQFYLAVLDADGTYTVQAFTANQLQVNFGKPLCMQAEVDPRLLSYQVYTYCYEDYTEFMTLDPDYDYNDLVLRVSHQRPADNQIRLNVTLTAVGTLNQVACAIRLIGLDYADVENVTIVDGESFDEGYKKTGDALISGSSLLLRGKNDEAVINLFEDAHYALGERSKNDLGIVERTYCNVSKGSGIDFAQMAPRTVSYLVTVKDASKLNPFTISSIDPFAIVADFSGYYELHPVGDNRHVQVLRPYAVSSAVVSLPWALAIPTGAFRYPLQGINLGFYKQGVLFGAYMTKNHSFGEWAKDHNNATDWYNYPTSNQVY